MNHLLLTLLNSKAFEMGFLFGKVVGFVGVGFLVVYLVRKSKK